MPRRSKKALDSRKAVHSSLSRTGRSAHLNINTNSQVHTNVTSRLESIGSLIIEELKGSKRDRLKQQLITSCPSQQITTNNLAITSSRRSLQQILADLYTLDCLTSRQYCTIGIGDDDDMNTSIASNKKSEVTVEKPNNLNMRHDGSQQSRTFKRKIRQKSALNSSQTVADKLATPLNTATRTICTRSSKLTTTNNNQEQFDHAMPTRVRKRRSSPSKHIETQSHVEHTTEKPNSDLYTTRGEDVSGVRVLRKKVQASIPSVEHEKTINDF